MEKQELCAQVVRSLLADQIEWVEQKMRHLRLASKDHGLTSLEAAIRADELARGIL